MKNTYLPILIPDLAPLTFRPHTLFFMNRKLEREGITHFVSAFAVLTSQRTSARARDGTVGLSSIEIK